MWIIACVLLLVTACKYENLLCDQRKRQLNLMVLNRQSQSIPKSTYDQIKLVMNNQFNIKVNIQEINNFNILPRFGTVREAFDRLNIFIPFNRKTNIYLYTDSGFLNQSTQGQAWEGKLCHSSYNYGVAAPKTEIMLHEIGHLLGYKHSINGIMMSRYNSNNDYMYKGLIQFSDEYKSDMCIRITCLKKIKGRYRCV